MGFLADLGTSAVKGAASGLMDFAFGGLKAKREWKYQQKQMALQHQYNLDEMWYEQQYNEANMSKQFDYQQQAWNAENAYNDPSAVRQRYEQAGISPQAALGGAASGAGLATSMDTPSSQSPSASGVHGSGSYGGQQALQYGMLADLELKRAQIENVDADTAKKMAEAENQRNYNSIFGDIAAGILLNNKNKDLDAQIKEVTAKWADIKSGADFYKALADIRTAVTQASLNESLEKKYLKEIDLAESQIGLNTEQAISERLKRPHEIASLREGANESHSRANLADEQALTESMIRDYKVSMAREGVDKISAETTEAKKRAEKIDKEIERIGKENNLTDEQIKASQQARYLAWSRYGADVARAISEEARAWIYFWKRERTSVPLGGVDNRFSY